MPGLRLGYGFCSDKKLLDKMAVSYTHLGEELCPQDLDGLCTVLVQNEQPDLRIGRSIPDEEWIRGKVPMTKEEIRTISLATVSYTHLEAYEDRQ